MWKALVKWVESWSYRCDHDWELIKNIRVYSSSDDKLPYKIVQTYRCTKCCEFKKINM